MSKIPELPEDEKELAKQLGLSYSDIHLLHLILVRRNILKESIDLHKTFIESKKNQIKVLDKDYQDILKKVN
tara:strand:+ start:132 stop:347 length:216 start_codon:yes stop_codon:yes gene_type:complete